MAREECLGHIRQHRLSAVFSCFGNHLHSGARVALA